VQAAEPLLRHDCRTVCGVPSNHKLSPQSDVRHDDPRVHPVHHGHPVPWEYVGLQHRHDALRAVPDLRQLHARRRASVRYDDVHLRPVLDELSVPRRADLHGEPCLPVTPAPQASRRRQRGPSWRCCGVPSRA
jgi:hypothetical protein